MGDLTLGIAWHSVRRAGNFNKLLVVRINEDFEFESRTVARKKLKNGMASTQTNLGNQAKSERIVLQAPTKDVPLR